MLSARPGPQQQGGKLACSPPVTPLERQLTTGKAAAAAVAAAAGTQILGAEGERPALSASSSPDHVVRAAGGPTSVGRGGSGRAGEKRHDEATSSDVESEHSGVATPDRVEEGASPSAADAQLASRTSERSSVGTQVGEDVDGLEPSAAEASRCLRVALRFAQQQIRSAPKPSARLASAIQTLAAFVETQAAAEQPKPPPAKRPHRAIRRNAVKPAADPSSRPEGATKAKAGKDDRKKLTTAEKRLLDQAIPDTFVVSDAISAKTVGATDLSTPRFKAASVGSLVGTTEAEDENLEDTGDAVFEALHRPRERVEREAHKSLFQPTRAQPARSPRAGPAAAPSPVSTAAGARGQVSVVAPLSLDSSAVQTATAEPDDWEVVGRRSGSNRITLRKMRKRRPEDNGERERKLLRAAVFAKSSTS
jgi:hypothetical protein